MNLGAVGRRQQAAYLIGRAVHLRQPLGGGPVEQVHEGPCDFLGIVLERRAVGVTATYPRFEVTSDGERAVAHVELPTFNCLTDHAPADPVAAGCLRSLTEYGDLATPELEVSRDGDGVRVSGRFPTYLRPNGTPPVWTGRVYELMVSAEPGAGDPDEGPVPATGVLELGTDRTETTGDDGNEVGSGP